MLLQAQASGAQAIGLAAVGSDLVNLVKQAAEFGLTRPGGPVLAGFLIYITEAGTMEPLPPQKPFHPRSRLLECGVWLNGRVYG